MKKLILTLVLAGIAAPAFSQEFKARFTARNDLDRTVKAVPTEGALQAAVREGSPVQMINPAAPLVYGSGKEFVGYEESDPFVPPPGRRRPVAIRLFAFVW